MLLVLLNFLTAVARRALGYGGNGITYAQIAADVMVGAITARRDVDADLCDFPVHK